jgi:hypothetical protein
MKKDKAHRIRMVLWALCRAGAEAGHHSAFLLLYDCEEKNTLFLKESNQFFREGK